jgi:2-(1,2-epoxy-1,2-dihydrophenyl)acetyl-CoA isomerase
MESHIIYAKEEGIAKVTLNRPEQMNAITPEMTQGLLAAIAEVKQDDSLRVLIITGAGRAFCSGADVKAMASKLDADPQAKWLGLLPAQLPPIPIALANLDKPTIAAVNGAAIGAGLDMALACDIRIASDRARFAEAYIRRGLMPATGGIYFLPRLVGIDRACELIWTGDMIEAKEAERIGLVTHVVPHEELAEATLDLATKLAKGPPLAIRMAKRAIYKGLSQDLESALEYVIPLARALHQTEDHAEGARAFLEKREPMFKGR